MLAALALAHLNVFVAQKPLSDNKSIEARANANAFLQI